MSKYGVSPGALKNQFAPTRPTVGPKALGKRLAHGAPMAVPMGRGWLRSLKVLWTNAGLPPKSHDEGRRCPEHSKFGPPDGAQANIRPSFLAALQSIGSNRLAPIGQSAKNFNRLQSAI